jgi:hypothetical protein
MKKANKLTVILKTIGIDCFIAIKTQYNNCAGVNDFYKMLKRRTTQQDAKELAYFLRHELHYHFKEYAQY